MTRRRSGLNVTLDRIHATQLRRLARRAGTEEEVLAELLLAHALDERDAHPRQVTDTLDAIPGAFERARLGRRQAHRGECVTLDEL